jgi:hypothetical protein
MVKYNYMAHDYKQIISKYEKIAETIPAIRPDFENAQNEYKAKRLDEYDYRQRLAEMIVRSKTLQNVTTLGVRAQDSAQFDSIEECINKSLTDIDKTKKTFEYRFAFAIIPAAFIINIILFFVIEFEKFCYISSGLMLVAVIYTYFALRFYQQTISTVKEFLEKRIGIRFLEIGIKYQDSKDTLTLIKYGLQMFMMHHGDTAKTFNHKDFPSFGKKPEKQNDD